MGSVRIVTDSTASVPSELVAKYGIEVIPLQVLFGGESFRDGVDLAGHEFYRRLKEARELPHTSQPSAGEFAESYRRLAADGSSIVSIHISGKLSGTVSSAQTAQGLLPAARITVIDTQTATMALGFAVIRAAEAASAGHPHEEVATIARYVAARAQIHFVVDTLEYLHKGGRIGGASALLGSILSLKPILTIRDGRVEPLDRVRTKAKALDRLVERVAKEVEDGQLHLSVLHANALAEAQALGERFSRQLSPVELYTAEVGPTIATHTGPGVLGAAFYVDK